MRSIAREVQLANLTLALAADERDDERCGSRPAHRPFERRDSREFQLFMNNEYHMNNGSSLIHTHE